ncbi:MAG: VanZ family protein [Paludibacter sp.]|jgi:VanZ family protein|nr:VanZ family protein [Paludibacter sp.]
MRYFLAYWKSLAVLIAIFVLSFMNPPSIPSVRELFSFDKIAHVIMYFGFTFVILNDTAGLKDVARKKPFYIYLGIGFPVFIGALTEVLQTILFAPRAAEWGDFLSDMAGIAVGWLAFALWQRWRRIVYN